MYTLALCIALPFVEGFNALDNTPKLLVAVKGHKFTNLKYVNFNNNFELICAVMLSAQTTDKRVNLVTPILFEKYPTATDLKKADINDVTNIIKSLGLANNKAKNIILLAKCIDEEHNNIIPNNLEDLMKLPGIGRKTASVVLALGYKIPAMPVDTHIHRVAIRLGYAKTDADVLAVENNLKRYIPKNEWIDAHHLILLFGRYHCKAKNPECLNCLLKE